MVELSCLFYLLDPLGLVLHIPLHVYLQIAEDTRKINQLKNQIRDFQQRQHQRQHDKVISSASVSCNYFYCDTILCFLTFKVATVW
jgi:hypothetical protein